MNQPPRHQLRMASREQMPSSDLAIADWTTKVFGPVLIYKYKNAVFTVFIGEGGDPPTPIQPNKGTLKQFYVSVCDGQ